MVEKGFGKWWKRALIGGKRKGKSLGCGKVFFQRFSPGFSNVFPQFWRTFAQGERGRLRLCSSLLKPKMLAKMEKENFTASAFTASAFKDGAEVEGSAEVDGVVVDGAVASSSSSVTSSSTSSTSFHRHKLLVEEMGRLTPEAFRLARKVPLVVVLDDVRSLYNVGSIFRTADAMGIGGLCLCGITGQPPQQEIHKTALGAEDSVAWRYFRTVGECLDVLRGEGYTIWAVEQVEGSLKLGRCAFPSRPLALVLGNEVKGVSQEAVDRADACLEVEQYGTKHSMNVSVTAGIVMWAAAQSLREGAAV